MKTLDAMNKKIFDDRIDWQRIDRVKALNDTRVLDLLREACLVESYLPVYTGKMNELFCDDVAATSIFTIEAFEAYGHYYILRRYLEIVEYKPVTDEEVAALRLKDKDKVYTDKIRELVNFMGTEHFAAEFFADLARLAGEPVLKDLLPRFSAEEVSHSQLVFDLLAEIIQREPSMREKVLEHALNFTHVGAYVLPKVSPAKEDNLKIIQGFNEKVGRLVGRRLSDAIWAKNGQNDF